MALKINIKPGEKFVINGAVLSVEERGTAIILQNHASFLREKDIMQEDEADSPAKRLYFVIMLMYIDSENADTYRERFLNFLGDFMSGCRIREVRQSLMRIYHLVNVGNFYQALKLCKSLIRFEDEVLKIGETFTAEELASLADSQETPA